MGPDAYTSKYSRCVKSSIKENIMEDANVLSVPKSISKDDLTSASEAGSSQPSTTSNWMHHRTLSEPFEAIPGLETAASNMSWSGTLTDHMPVSGSDPKFSPVIRSSYSSLPQTPAVMFLAGLAEAATYVKPPTKVHEGSVISGYVLGRVIGRGSYSHCREGYREGEPERRLALKIVENTGLQETIENEIEIWARLDHPGFLQLIDVIRLHDLTIVVSPLAELGSLLKVLQKNGPLDAGTAKKIFKQLCDALDYLHNKLRIVHHDIKLENILLDKEFNAYICDFGLSEYVDEHSRWCYNRSSQEDLMMKGSLWYLPPEVIDCSRSRRVSISKLPQLAAGDWKIEKSKVDIWALGIVLYAMVTGGLPFTQDYLPKLQQAILAGEYPPLEETTDEKLCELVSQLLTIDPESRPLINRVIHSKWLHE